MTCARWIRVLSVLSLFAMLTAPRPALARTPGPTPTPAGGAHDVQPPLVPVDGHIRVVYAKQQLDMSTTDSSGEAYVDMNDPALLRFFNLHGVTVRWSDRTATLYGGGHYLMWAVNAPRGLVDGKDATLPQPPIVDRDGGILVSLRGLAQCLGFRLRPDAAPGTFRFLARLEKLELRNSGDREVTLHASGPLDDAQSATAGQSMTLRLANVEWGFEERSFQFGDVNVQCAGSGSDADPATMTVTVPVQWRTERTGRLLANEAGVRVVAEFQAEAGKRPENLNNLRHYKGIGDFYVMLEATGPIKHMWRFDPQQRVLTVDVPQATVGTPLTAQLNAEIERVEAEDMHTAAFPFVRIRAYVKEGYGAEVRVGEGNRLTIRVAALALLPMTAMSGGDADTSRVTSGTGFIVIDPGHGGSDPGAVNKSLGLCEKDITLDISKRLRAALERRGFRVKMTREDDRDVSWARSPDGVELGARVNVANANGADLFVSIHCNSSVSSALTGTTYHWFKPSDLPLAKALSGALTNGTGFNDKGPIRNRFYVLRRTNMPAVLVETAFISNNTEASRLADPDIRQKIADGIADKLSQHLPARAGRGGAASTSYPRP